MRKCSKMFAVLVIACLWAPLFAHASTPAGSVVRWGHSYWADNTVPADLGSNVVAVAASGEHSLALKGDGTVVAWGRNNWGQTDVPAGLSNVVAVAAGGDHSLALKGDGTVVAWGDNGDGQLNVPEGLTGVVEIAAGGEHSLALKSDGTFVGWGFNHYGQTSVPSSLIGVNDIVAIDAGSMHSLALRSNGIVVVWGMTNYGATNIPEGLSGVVAIAAGAHHNVVLKSDGSLVRWGWNDESYTQIPEGLTGVVAIACGAYHNLALKSDGTVVAWGSNDRGERDVPAGLSDVVAIAPGGSQNLVIVSPVKADLLIKKGSERIGAYSLNDIYQGVPSGDQIETQTLGKTLFKATYNVRVQNDTTETRSFVLRTVENEASGWNVVYIADGINITAALRSEAGYTTPGRAPGGSHIVTVEMTRESGVTSTKSAAINVFSNSSNTIVRDSVQAVTVVDEVVPTSCVVTVPSHNTFIGSNNLTELSGTATDNVGGTGIHKVFTLILRPKSGGGYEYWGLNPTTKVYEWSGTQRQTASRVTPVGGQSVTWSRTNGLPKGADLPPGTYYAWARAYDAASNSKYSSLNTFTVVSDTVNPTAAALTSPANGGVVDNLSQVSGTASDNTGGSGINRVFVTLSTTRNGVTEWWGQNPSTLVYEWSTTWRTIRANIVTPLNGINVSWSLTTNLPSGENYTHGTYLLRGRAYDVVGNSKYTDINTIYRFSDADLARIPASQNTQATLSDSSTILSDSSARVGGSGEATVKLTFSDVIDGSVAGDASHYQVTVNGQATEVQNVAYDALTKTVTLNLPANAFAKGDQVVVQWSDLQDGQRVLFSGESGMLKVN